MSTLALIVAFGLAMSAIALVGSITLVLPERTFNRVVVPLVALAAGSLRSDRTETAIDPTSAAAPDFSG